MCSFMGGSEEEWRFMYLSTLVKRSKADGTEPGVDKGLVALNLFGKVSQIFLNSASSRLHHLCKKFLFLFF